MSQPTVAVAPATTSLKPQAPTSKLSQPILQKSQPNPSGSGQASTKRSPPPPKPSLPLPKKLPGRSSKPIINWFQRKLAGTVKPNRREVGGRPEVQTRTEDGTMRRVGPTWSKSTRVTSSPFPQPSLLSPRYGRTDNSTGAARRKPISLNGADDGQRSARSYDGDDVDQFTNRSSLARESTWSPTSNMEADEDASVRPLPPSGPPSPSPSLSASSYLSDPHTFRSMAASTKPTTLLSIDLAPNGVAHIAQVPTTPLSQSPRFPPHVRSSSAGTSGGGVIGSGASITFSPLPMHSPSRPSSLNNVNSHLPNSPSRQSADASGQISSVQAPLHTAHHPRNNPRPSSPPMDNASMLTLASSAFAMSGTRMGTGFQGWTAGTPSARAMDSISHFGGSFIGDGEGDISSQYDRLDVDGDRDVDASVRALRPRSSRRGSWGSEASDWSAPNNGAGTSTGTPSRSLWTTNSIRTGGQLSLGDDGQNEGSDGSGSVDDDDEGSLELQTPLRPADPLPIDSDEETPQLPIPKGVETTPKKRKGDGLTLEESSDTVPLPSHDEQKGATNGHDGLEPNDAKSSVDNLADVWHSAPTTPMI